MEYKYNMSNGLSHQDRLRMMEIIINATANGDEMLIVCPPKYEHKLKNYFVSVRVLPLSAELLGGEDFIYLTSNIGGVLNV